MLIKSYCSQVMSDLCYLLQKRTIAQAIVTGVMQRLLVRIPMSSHIGTCKAGFLGNGKKGFLQLTPDLVCVIFTFLILIKET